MCRPRSGRDTRWAPGFSLTRMLERPTRARPQDRPRQPAELSGPVAPMPALLCLPAGPPEVCTVPKNLGVSVRSSDPALCVSPECALPPSASPGLRPVSPSRAPAQDQCDSDAPHCAVPALLSVSPWQRPSHPAGVPDPDRAPGWAAPAEWVRARRGSGQPPSTWPGARWPCGASSTRGGGRREAKWCTARSPPPYHLCLRRPPAMLRV